ncbi:MAG: 2TM domain-containing protein [Flavobacterium sp.]|nr:2TM domain-containing protein [Flavobacterium sp.]
METNLQQDERYYFAKKKVTEIKGFYGNLISYIIFNGFFLILNLKSDPSHLWFYWPLLGWGIGVIFHGMRVFNYTPFLGKNWEERKIKELMEKEKITKTNWK